MHWRNLGYEIALSRPSNAVAAGTTEIDGASIDTLAVAGGPIVSVMAICALGTVTDTSVTSLKLQGSLDGSTNWTDLGNTHQTCNPTGDSNKLLATCVYRVEGYRYVRPVVTRATANAAVDAIIMIGYNAASTPITTQDSTVSVPAAGGSGSQGSGVGIPINVIDYATAGTA